MDDNDRKIHMFSPFEINHEMIIEYQMNCYENIQMMSRLTKHFATCLQQVLHL